MDMNIILTMPENAEAAMTFYQTVFPLTELENVVHYTSDMPNVSEKMVGKVLHGEANIQGTSIYFMDMDQSEVPAKTWATAIYIDFHEAAEFDDAFNKLSAEGTVMMGPKAMGNLQKMAWVTDKFGVTWQMVFE